MSLILFGVSGMGIWFWIVTSSDPGAGTWKSWIWAMLVLPGLGSKAGTKAEKACLRVWSSSKLRPPPDTSSSSYTHAHTPKDHSYTLDDFICLGETQSKSKLKLPTHTEYGQLK